MEHAQAIKVPGAGKPLVWDWLFLVLLVAALTGSAWVGVLAYREGMKTEATKRLGEAWLAWMTDNAAHRASDSFPASACAARPGNTWGACQAWLLSPDGPFHEQRNAYTGDPIKVIAACGGTDRRVAGMVALERVTPLPPGSAIPFVVAPLAAQDAIDQKVIVRVAVCHVDTSPIRVGEAEF